MEIKKKYPGKRMSQIVHEGALNDVEVDLNAKIKRDGYVVLHYNGNIKFVLEKGYNTAVKSIVNCAVNDIAKKVIKTDSEGMIFGITSKGNAITFPVSALGEDKWKSKGMGINKIAKVDSDDKLLAIFTSDELKGKKLFIVTSMGMAKYIEVDEFTLDKKSLASAMAFKDEEDFIVAVEAVQPPEVDDGTRDARGYVLSISAEGMVLNSYDDIPTQGKKASGVKLMRLDDKDRIIFASHNDGSGEVVSLSDSGYAKRVILGCIEPRMRMSKGVKLSDSKSGECVYADLVTVPYDVAVIFPGGAVRSVNTEDIPIDERTNKGKNIIKAIAKDLNVMTVGDAKRHNII